MSESAPSEKLAELQRLRERVAELESEVAETVAGEQWRSDVYWTYYATTGFFLGMLAALASLLFNVLGSVAIGQSPFKIIAIYLTFGLGENAQNIDTANNGPLALAIGCCLYVGTGMVLGIPFQMIFSRFGAGKGIGWRLIVSSILGIAIWLVNYYLVLSWLQPLLFGGNWIVEDIPVLVAAFTHLIFGWTMALTYPLGKYEPYHVRND
jgi:hypothetical protein